MRKSCLLFILVFALVKNAYSDNFSLATYQTFTLSDTVAYADYIDGNIKILNCSGTFTGYLTIGFYIENTLMFTLWTPRSTITLAAARYEEFNLHNQVKSPCTAGDYIAKAVYSTDGINWIPISNGYQNCPTEAPVTITMQNSFDLRLADESSNGIQNSPVTYEYDMNCYFRIRNIGFSDFYGYVAVAAYSGNDWVAWLYKSDVSIVSIPGVNAYPTGSSHLLGGASAFKKTAIAPLVPGDYIAKIFYSTDGTNWTPITSAVGGGLTEFPFTIVDNGGTHRYDLRVGQPFSINSPMSTQQRLRPVWTTMNYGNPFQGYLGMGLYNDTALIKVCCEAYVTLLSMRDTTLRVFSNQLQVPPGTYWIKAIYTTDDRRTWIPITVGDGNCPIQLPLTISSGIYHIDVSSANNEQGSVSGAGYYSPGDTAVLRAIPQYGYHFLRWNDLVTSNPRIISVYQDQSYTAYFAPNTYTVAISSTDMSMGTTSGSGEYTYLSQAIATATPNSGHYFVSWSDGNTSNPRPLTITADTALAAIFSPNLQYRITVGVSDTACGIAVGGGLYYAGETATISAVAKEHYYFVSWDDGVSSNPRRVTVVQNASYIALFSPIAYSVMVSANNYTMGSVSGSGTYDYGSYATIVAQPFAGYKFVEWSDGNTEAQRRLLVEGNITLEARFEETGGTQGIANTEEHVYSVKQRRGQIIIEGAHGERVELYDVMGREVYSIDRADYVQEIAVKTFGIYMLRVGSSTPRKIIMIR